MLSPSGGLVYHARATRRASRGWRPFREAVERWLMEWRTPCTGLILVGPSGGYTLPTAWLRRFEHIVAIDFDPLAPALFARRHGKDAVSRWIAEDVLPAGPGGLDLRPLRRRLAEYSDHTVLFSNVLGQVALAAPDQEAVERDLGTLPRWLENRHWASYHDRLSASSRPSLPLDSRHRSDRDLAALAYPLGGEVSSHSTARLGEGLPAEYFEWECAKGYWHLIEACRGRTVVAPPPASLRAGRR